jgi:hypothetical protein
VPLKRGGQELEYENRLGATSFTKRRKNCKEKGTPTVLKLVCRQQQNMLLEVIGDQLGWNEGAKTLKHLDKRVRLRF